MKLSPARGAARAVIALAAGGAMLLAGCGSDDEVSGEAAAPAVSATTTSTEPTEPTEPEDTVAPDADTTEEPAPEAATETPADEPAQEIVITIVDFAYELPESVPPGATVTVVNEDAAAHTATSTGVFDVNLTAGETGTFTAPDEPGEYDIICLFHGNMVATLVVA